MTLIEKIVLFYVATQTAYTIFAVFRDILFMKANHLSIERGSLARIFENERRTLIGNVEIEREKAAMYKNELAIAKKRIEGLRIEIEEASRSRSE